MRTEGSTERANSVNHRIGAAAEPDAAFILRPVAKDTEKLIRQLSLISFLMANRRPVSALEIKQEVEGYSSMNEDAFARRFYADRAELESLGIHLQVQKPGEGFFEAELYALPPEKIVVTPNGVDPVFAPAGASDGSQGSSYVLAVGAVQPRKNQLAALEAARAVGLPLVVAGPEKDKTLADELRRRGARVACPPCAVHRARRLPAPRFPPRRWPRPGRRPTPSRA